MDALKTIKLAIGDIPNLHNGGCGISALAISKFLGKKKIKWNEFVILCRDDYDYNESFDNFMEGNYRDMLFDHIAILLPTGEIIDAKGTYREYYYNSISINRRELIKIINVKDGWCGDFDRKYVRTIERKLNISLKEVKIWNQRAGYMPYCQSFCLVPYGVCGHLYLVKEKKDDPRN